MDLSGSGQLSCFYHNQNAYNLMAEIYIHSVYDVGFDEKEGRMKVFSIINDATKTQETSYANSTNDSIGNLAAQTSKSNNAYGVYQALRNAMDAGTVVDDKTILNEQSWWPDNVKEEETNQDVINLYNNYKKLSSETTLNGPSETGEEITINNKAYSIVGPFKVTFGGKGIKEVTAGDATWKSKSDTSIYWSTTKSEAPSDWSNDFSEQTSAKYKLDNKQFYLAVETSKLPNDGNYQITMEQDKFEYYNSRTIICESVYAQQTGMYAYDNNPTPVVGSVKWTVTRTPTDKTLVISKIDQKTKEKIKGAGFKIYAELKNGTKGWVSGTVEGNKTYESNKANATEYADSTEIKNLKFGDYYIYETKAPNGYDLKEQDGYQKAKDGIPTPTGEWAYIKPITINAKSDNTVTFEVTNKKASMGILQITKIDADTEQKLSGGQFKIYAVLNDGTTGWVGGAPRGEKIYGKEGAAFNSDTNIDQLKPGKYYIFETTAPEGYNMKKQDYYKKTDQTDKNIANIKLTDSDWVYLGNKEIPKNIEENQQFEFEGKNKKTVDKLEGYVWLDVPDTKANKSDNVYIEGTNDARLEGIEVTLYDSNKQAIATARTDKNGYYSFTTKNSPTYTGEDKNLYYWELVNAYVEFTYDNKEYVCVDPFAQKDGKMDLGINSKAQEATMTTEKLDDKNLTGTDEPYPGKAVTYKGSKLDYKNEEDLKKIQEENAKVEADKATADDLKTAHLTGYYDNETYTISNINLGLIERNKPSFSVTEEVAYMKVKFGDNVYKYIYGEENDKLKRTTVPKVNKIGEAKIYPSDVAYNEEQNNETLKVYMVYRINVYNTTSHNNDNNYIEDKMYIESLTNTYDSKRYVLNTTDYTKNIDSDEVKSAYELWTPNGTDSKKNAVAAYKCNERTDWNKGVKTELDENGDVKELGYATTYIQFQLTKDSVGKILERSLTDEYAFAVASKATATTFHEYWRADNVWEDGKEKYYEGHKQEKYDEPKSANRTYYLHKSLTETKSSDELWMRFDLPEKERAISGTVFEDTVTEESKTKSEVLGDGIKQDTENTVSDVLVELVNSKDAKTPVELYRLGDSGDGKNYHIELASQKVEKGGEFKFEGVIPGEYYLRFTYGDETVKYTDSEGKEVGSVDIKTKLDDTASTEVKINDYKSTIIDATTEDGKTIKAAMEDDTKGEWYKDITGENYSTALDDMEQRHESDGYTYHSDGKITDKDGNEVTARQHISAYTPKISVTIENDQDESRTSSEAEEVGEEGEKTLKNKNYYYFNGFNFGIIKAPKTNVEVQKTVSKLSLTDQVGTTIISEDPKDKNAQHVSALDDIGATIRAEIDPSLIYGSVIEPEYTITIKNSSDNDYIGNTSENLEDYYKYGLKDNAELKTMAIQKLKDIIDAQYDIDTVKVIAYYINDDKVDDDKYNIEITKSEESADQDGNVPLEITGWSEGIKPEQSESVQYTVKALLSSDNEDGNGFTNKAEVAELKLSPLTPLGTPDYEATPTVISITPPTGTDKTNIYWVAATIALIALAVGIIVINQKALKE